MSEFDKIIGYKEIKDELIRLCDVVKNYDKYKKLGVTPIKGIMIKGVPGVGKTLMANCFLKESGRNTYIVRKNKGSNDFINEINNVFNEAKKNAPSIILLDDLDKFSSDDIYSRRNSDEFVLIQTLMDEINGDDVSVIATINESNVLPNSLTRSGRFDAIITVQTPKYKDSTEIIKYYLSNKKVVDDIDYEEIANLLNGKSCADLETVINSAGLYAGYDSRDKINLDDIIKACLREIYDAPESVKSLNSGTLKKIAVHEAGHAVVAEALKKDTVALVSIRNNTGSKGGFTIYKNDEDYWSSKKCMEDRVIALLAGKAATEVVYGETDTGICEDLKRAFGLVERFVDDYSSYGFNYFATKDSSEALLSRRDDRMISDIEMYYLKAKEILVKNRKFLDELTNTLLTKDTLVSKDIKEIRDKTLIND